jgi:HK97 gp10 family phage protein
MASYNTTKRLVHITGLDQISAVLNEIPRDLRTNVTAKVVRAGAVPLEVSMKRYARRSVRTGSLREAIGTVVKRYKDSGTAVAIVGVQRGYYRKRTKLGSKEDKRGSESPSHYAHLVEYGHNIVTGGTSRDTHEMQLVGTGRFTLKGKEIKRWKKGALKEKAKGKTTGWVKAKPFIRPAFLTTKTQVLSEMHKALERAVMATVKRGTKQGWHKAA